MKTFLVCVCLLVVLVCLMLQGSSKLFHFPPPVTTATTVLGNPTISASFIDAQLCTHHSPACHTGQSLYDLGVKYNVDPVFPLAFFWHASRYATVGIGRMTHSVGDPCYGNNSWGSDSLLIGCVNEHNTPCQTTGQGCYATYSDYPTGYDTWYRLITSQSFTAVGLDTVAQIIPVYVSTLDAKSKAAYISDVTTMVTQYRTQSK